MPSPEKPARDRRAALVLGGLVIAGAGLGVTILRWSHRELATAPGAPHAATPNPAAPSAPAADAGRARDAAPSADAAGAAAVRLPPEILTAVANWATRLDHCRLPAARADKALGFIRFELTPDFRVGSARVLNAATAADLSDDCSRAALGAPRTLPAGEPPLTVWWPVGRAPQDDAAV